MWILETVETQTYASGIIRGVQVSSKIEWEQGGIGRQEERDEGRGAGHLHHLHSPPSFTYYVSHLFVLSAEEIIKPK